MDENDLAELVTVAGGLEADIVKSKLESFSIPALLRYEAAGRIFGITMDGLGKVKILVSRGLLEEARQVLAAGPDDPAAGGEA